jgi:hypothetical protein
VNVLKQIILMPQTDYWSWVRACKEFVMTFRASMTRDPETAVRHMAPRQVVTVVTAGDAYPEYGDILSWLKQRNPDLRLDIITAMTPGELKMALDKRIEEGDQFGQGAIEIRLAWPTEFPIITQSFGSNPEIYGAYGFPGHEGVDIWALMGSKVFCCMDGEVYKVHEVARVHPYGKHICILHKGGYRTVYGHLLRIDVEVGQLVKAGQVIGLADTTGTSSGNHLHLSLRHDGATERMETNYPKDVIDPTPYLVWPEGPTCKTFNRIEWAAGKCLVGAHGRVDGVLRKGDIDVIKTARLEAIKISLHETRETIDMLRRINPGMLLMARIDRPSWDEPVDVDDFLGAIEKDIGRLLGLGVRQFEVLANPNLVGKGWARSWRDGTEFGEWYMRLLEKLREKFTGARFGFPGLSPGGSLIGHRMSADDFIAGAAQAAATADWIGVNCHWTDGASMRAAETAYEEYRARFPSKLLMITEFSNPTGDDGDMEKAQQYLDFYRGLRNTPGIGAAFAFAISAENGHNEVAWRNGSDSMGKIPETIGSRNF